MGKAKENVSIKLKEIIDRGGYDDDVQIIVKDGKIYCLLSSESQ